MAFALTPPNWPYLPRLAFTVAYIRLLTFDYRRQVPAALFALSLTSAFVMRDFWSPWLTVSWVSLVAAACLTPLKAGPRGVLIGLTGLLALVFLSVPGSLVWGSGNWVLSLGVGLWMAPTLLFYLGSGIGNRVLAWMVPAWVIHAGFMLYQAATSWAVTGDGIYVRGHAPDGLSTNTNLGAGLLVLGVSYLLTTRYKWLALPLFLAILASGSRWAAIVCLVVVLGMALSRRVPWRPVVIGASSVVGLAVALWALQPISVSYIAGFDRMGALMAPFTNGELTARLAVPHIPSMLPRGVAEHPGLHNVPLRIAVENGIVAAGLWLGIAGWALAKAPRLDTAWWMLLALCLLSMLDYYSWMGHLGGFWWLLVGLRVKGTNA